MTRAIAQVLLAHWRRNPLQFATLVIGIALATALWSGVQAINAEARASFAEAGRTIRSADQQRFVAKDGGAVTIDDFRVLRRNGILVSPYVSGEITIGGQPVTLIGVEPLTAPRGIWPEPSTGQQAPDPRVLFVSTDIDPGPGMIPQTGLPAATAIGDIAEALRRLERSDFDALLLAGPPVIGAPDPAVLRPGLRLRTPPVSADPGALTASFRLNLQAFGALCFIVGLFIVRGTIGLVMAQRRSTIASLRAMGVPMGRLSVMIAVELAAIATIAGAAGVLMGYMIARFLMPDVAATIEGIYGSELSQQVELRPVWWLGGLSLALIGTLATALGPLLRSTGTRIMPVRQQLPLGKLAFVGLGLCAMSGFLAWQVEGLIAGFAAIAALLLGGAALAPVVLSLLTRVFSRLAAGPLSVWVLAETRAQIPQMSLAMTALLLAIAANVGVSTMVGSFRASFVEFLDQRLAAELYVSGGQDPGRLEAALTQAERVLPVKSERILLRNVPVDLYGVVDDSTYREDWQPLFALPGAWDRLYAGGGAVINEQLYHRMDLRPGDVIELPDGEAEIVAVIADYGNPDGQVLISMPRFDALAPDAKPKSFGLRSLNPEGLRARLIDAGIPPGEISSQEAVKTLSMRVFDRTFTITAALNILTLGVAGFAIFTSLLTLGDMRLPRLAPLWAMGIERPQLGAAELIQVTLLAGLTVLCAIPLGLGLTWLLLEIVNVEAFGWRLPFRSAPLEWIGLAAFGLGAAIFASLWPVWQLARSSPRRLLEVFSRVQ